MAREEDNTIIDPPRFDLNEDPKRNDTLAMNPGEGDTAVATIAMTLEPEGQGSSTVAGETVTAVNPDTAHPEATRITIIAPAQVAEAVKAAIAEDQRTATLPPAPAVTMPPQAPNTSSSPPSLVLSTPAAPSPKNSTFQPRDWGTIIGGSLVISCLVAAAAYAVPHYYTAPHEVAKGIDFSAEVAHRDDPQALAAELEAILISEQLIVPPQKGGRTYFLLHSAYDNYFSHYTTISVPSLYPHASFMGSSIELRADLSTENLPENIIPASPLSPKVDGYVEPYYPRSQMLVVRRNTQDPCRNDDSEGAHDCTIVSPRTKENEAAIMDSIVVFIATDFGNNKLKSAWCSPALTISGESPQFRFILPYTYFNYAAPSGETYYPHQISQGKEPRLWNALAATLQKISH